MSFLLARITTCNVCQNEGEWSRVQNIVTPMDHTVLYMQLIHGLSRFEFNIQKILWWEGGGIAIWECKCTESGRGIGAYTEFF